MKNKEYRNIRKADTKRHIGLESVSDGLSLLLTDYMWKNRIKQNKGRAEEMRGEENREKQWMEEGQMNITSGETVKARKQEQ